MNIKVEELEPTESRIQVRSECGKKAYIKGYVNENFRIKLIFYGDYLITEMLWECLMFPVRKRGLV